MQRIPRLTYRVDLPGGQRRLREAILYVSKKYAEAEHFGLVKLNKTIWKADFDAFRERLQPVTGRQYKRQQMEPVPYEMLPLLNEMRRSDEITVEYRPIAGLTEERVIAQVIPGLRDFSPADLSFLDRAVKFYWDYTGTETSDHSHGVAWKTRENGDDMPYELTFLSDAPLDEWEQAYFGRLAKQNSWRSFCNAQHHR